MERRGGNMTLEEAAKELGFTVKSLKILVRLGVIQRILTDEDIVFLSRLKQIWKNRVLLSHVPSVVPGIAFAPAGFMQNQCAESAMLLCRFLPLQ